MTGINDGGIKQKLASFSLGLVMDRLFYPCAQCAIGDACANLCRSGCLRLAGQRETGRGARVLDRRGADFRQGNPYHPPAGFTDGFPPFALDGELYVGSGQFAQTSGNIRGGENWTGIKLHVFDVPDAEGGLLTRLEKIQQWLSAHPEANIVVIKQIPIANIDQAEAMLDEIIDRGGEGVILRDPQAPYLRTRSETMLKLKRWQDDECVITAHLPGNGKYSGMLGAVECRWKDGQIIRLGSGFSDAERQNPPMVGQTVTFRYHGLTRYGKPRFASFWRVREAE